MKTLFLLLWFIDGDVARSRFNCTGSTFTSFDPCTLRIERFQTYDAAAQTATKVLLTDKKSYWTAIIHDLTTGQKIIVRRDEITTYQIQSSEAR